VGRSCRQGDPIAPYLFILAIEPLLRQLKHDDEVVGLQTPLQEVKFTAYADDITLLLKNQASLDKALAIIDDFGSTSGLLLNRDKTEIMLLDASTEEEANTIKVTGVVHAAAENRHLAEKENFEPLIAKLRNMVNTWKMRALSLTGRAMVAKAQGWAQFQHISMAVHVPTWAAKQIDDILYKFIWKGPDRVKRVAMTSGDDRSLKLFETKVLNDMHLAQWLSRAAAPANAWADFLPQETIDHILRDGGKAKAYYKPKPNDSRFHTLVVRALQDLQETYNPHKIRENSTLEGNSLFRDRDRKTLKLPQLRRLRYRVVADVLEADGSLKDKPLECAQNLALAMEWEAIRRYVMPTVQRHTYAPRSDTNTVTRTGTCVIGDQALPSDRITYRLLAKAIRNLSPQITPPKWAKATAALGTETPISYRNMKKWAADTRTRDFVFRWNSGLLYARKDLHRFNIKDKHECIGCNSPEQTVEHLFWHCQRTRWLVREVASRLRIPPAALDPEYNGFIPHLQMKIFHIIYVKNFDDTLPSPDEVVAELRNWLAVEKAIRERLDQTEKFLKLWDKFL
jgi:hypothetical protein